MISLLPDITSSLTTLVMKDLKAIQKSLGSFATKDLQKLLSSVQTELNNRNKSDLVELIPNYCTDDVTLQAVWAECESLDFGNNTRKAAAKWFSSNKEPYVYNDSNPVHPAIDISSFPAVSRLMDQINADNRFIGPVDSALILKYTCEATSTSLHADDEDYLDQTKSICNFSIGSTRSLEFFDKSNSKNAVKTVVMDNNSMTHMKPGTQQLLKHMVRGSKAKAPGVRYSISFRALNKQQSSSNSNTECTGNTTSSAPPMKPGVQTPKRRVCLIAGDSYPARLDAIRLGRNNRVQIEMLADGGSKMDKVAKQLEDYRAANTDVIVEKICISVGTNDIRNCNNGVNHLQGPFKQFCQKVVDLYPNSKVFFQTLLPLPCNGENDWKTNSKVIRFNQIILNECIFRKFYVIDAFKSFMLPIRSRWSPHIRNDSLFSGADIHPSVNKGNAVLARLYIRVLHSRYFNPYVYQ